MFPLNSQKTSFGLSIKAAIFKFVVGKELKYQWMFTYQASTSTLALASPTTNSKMPTYENKVTKVAESVYQHFC